MHEIDGAHPVHPVHPVRVKLVHLVAGLALGASSLVAQPATVRGVVRAPDGRPVPFAEVVANDSTRTRTDSAGAFTLGTLAAGDLELLVRRVGFYPVSIPLHLVAGQRRALAIELAALPYSLDPSIIVARKPGIFGQVVDEHDVPIPGAELVVAGSGTRVRSAKDGGFALPNLNAGTYMVLARAQGFVAGQFSVALTGEQGQELRIRMETIDESIRGAARRAAEGRFWTDTVFLLELDRRLRENHGAVIARQTIAAQGERSFGELMRDAPLLYTSNVQGASGPTSINSAGTQAPSPASQALAELSGGSPKGWCYVLNGGDPGAHVPMPISEIPSAWIESIEVLPNDKTNTLLRRTSPSCTHFVVIWLRR